MKIKYLTLLIFVVFANAVFAQKDTLIYYLKDSGALADNLINADYKLVVFPPDPAVDKNLSILKAYLPDGSLKFIASSMSNTLPLMLQGYYTEYYSNGNKKLVRYFNNGEATGYKTDYYPNGQLQLDFQPDGTGGGTKKEYYPDGTLKMEHYPTGNHHANETEYYSNGKAKRKDLIDSLGRGSVTEYYETGATKSLAIFKRSHSRNATAYFPNGNLYYKKSYFYRGDGSLETDYEECRDSTGKILTQNGNGFWVEYNDNFMLKTYEGKVKHNLPDSIWKISYSSTAGEMDTYKKGELLNTDVYVIKNTVSVLQNEVFSQKPEATYYLNKFGYVYSDIKDADYLLLILPPDTSTDKNLFVVKEYYANGDLRFISGTKSLKLEEIDPQKPGFSKPVLQGGYIAYFHNGHKMEIAYYEDGSAMGDDILYYPNGKLYCTKTFVKDKPALYKVCRDSTGNVLFENGNGKGLVFLDESFKNYLAGEVISGLPQGEWNGKLNDTTNAIGTYKDGELKTEAIVDKNGQKTYTKPDVVAAFPGGLQAFSKFLGQNIHYPARAREDNTQGRVIVTFVVDPAGKLADIKMLRGVGDGCDEEAVRVLKLSPLWTPGLVDNKPVRVQYSVPISFSLGK